MVACPTGIDIRQGLQLECIACGQCADACDSIMDRIHKPQGLIRYASQAALEAGKKSPVLRPRVAIYGLVLLGLLTTLLLVGGKPSTSELTLLRGLGAPFSESGDDVVNQLRLKVHNRTDNRRSFSVTLLGMPSAKVVAPELPLVVAPGQQAVANFFVVAPRSELHGSRRVQLRIGDAQDSQLVTYTLLGPE